MTMKAVFFDFDGVILDSVNIKTAAFAAMFRSYGPEIEQQVTEYHINHGGVSRFDKFHYYYTQLLDKPLSSMELERLCREFSAIVFNQVVQAPFIKGAMATLKDLKKCNIPAFVVSGTPDAEIRSIVQLKNLESFFVEVHGSPKSKEEITAELLRRKKFTAKECLFVGDSMSDYLASTINKMPFLGIVPDGGTSPFPSHVTIVPIVQLAINI